MGIKLHVRKNDRVVVITGKYKGKTGRVIEVMPRKRKVLVEGVNIVKRHTRANTRAGVAGGIIEREAPIDVSNVMLIDPHTGTPTRVGRQVLADGTRVRVAKKSGSVIEKQ
ncbi:MAG TPA: 50S ribosomal protein L24 [Blastocatellia bacterium]|nr:50S ribosomal protein L24 [Blastocatellia bacterium]